MDNNKHAELVLVTGGSGFIGRALVARLARRYRVVSVDRSCPAESPPEHDCAEIDLTSDDSVRGALQAIRERHGHRIAAAIHLAAYFDLEGKPHPDYERVTVRGTERLLRGLRSTFELEQFVFASTMLVHLPRPPGQRIDEDAPVAAKLPYRESKIRTEALLREQHGDVPVVFVRPAGVYDDQGHAVFLAHQIARIYERKLNSRVYPGNPDTGQPYLHLDDLVDALARIVERRQSLPPVLPLLLAEERTLSFRELQHEIGCLVHGEEWNMLRIPQAAASAGAALEETLLDEDPFIRPWMVEIASDHYEIDISRARKLLDWQPRHSLRETLPKIVAALKADPPGWYRGNKLNPAVVAARAPAVRGEAGHADRDGEHRSGMEEHERMPGMQEHMQQMRHMHFQMLWVHWLNMLLGAWLLFAPWAFGAWDPQGFSESVRRVTVERELSEPLQRLAWLAWSDVTSGALIVVFGALSMSPRFAWAQWANGTVGVWLLFAPLVFWSPSAAVYANDTMVGSLVIAFALLVPMMPGMSHAAMADRSDLPVGWTYSPSTYLQRLPIIVLGFVGFLIARQLTAYQLGLADGVWEPFFAGSGGRDGTETIITSDVSKAWPIPDAGLGAVSYLFEVMMGAMGDRRRWRTMPWMVAAFGIVVVPLGVVSIYFIIIQPIVIGTWCSLCLLAAAVMLVMIPYALDELVAMGQFLVQSHGRGEPFWRTIFQGGASADSGNDGHPGFDAPLRQALASALRGVTLPWTLLASAGVGAALMFTRLLFGTQPPLAHSDHLVGALVVTMAVMAWAEVGRPLRFVNVAFGLWLVAAPWILEGGSTAATVAGMLAGAAIILLSLPRGQRSSEHYGSWDRFVL